MPNEQPHQNPFAAPLADDSTWAGPGVGSEAAQLREQHINHEASLKTIGFLHYLAAISSGLGVVAAVGGLLSDAAGGGNTDIMPTLLGTTVLAVIAFAYGAIGRGLRHFQRWVRPWATITSLLGVFWFPVGTILGLIFVYLLWCRKSNIVFSEEYKQVIAQTPHVKRKTSIIVKIFLGLLLVVIALAFVGFLVGP